MQQTYMDGAPAGMPADLVSRPSDATLLLAAARNAAYAEAARGRVGLGLNLLMDALDAQPLSHDLMSDMAALLLSAGELSHAVAYAQRALEVAPRHGASLYSLGFALAGLGEIDQAIEALVELTRGDALRSLQHEAPELLPLAQTELARLLEQARGSQAAA